MSKIKAAVAALSLSATAFVGIALDEHYTEAAVIPTKGDRPTVGFGSTFHEDGKAVKMGDKTTPVNALVKIQAHIAKDEKAFRASLPGAYLSQTEYDIYMDFVYQYGMENWSKSSMRKEILAGNHAQACQGLLNWKFAAGFDCSTPGNKVCAGVWTRQLKRHANCMAAQ